MYCLHSILLLVLPVMYFFTCFISVQCIQSRFVLIGKDAINFAAHTLSHDDYRQHPDSVYIRILLERTFIALYQCSLSNLVSSLSHEVKIVKKTSNLL